MLTNHIWCLDPASHPSRIDCLLSAFPYQSWVSSPEMRFGYHVGSGRSRWPPPHDTARSDSSSFSLSSCSSLYSIFAISLAFSNPPVPDLDRIGRASFSAPRCGLLGPRTSSTGSLMASDPLWSDLQGPTQCDQRRRQWRQRRRRPAPSAPPGNP